MKKNNPLIILSLLALYGSMLLAGCVAAVEEVAPARGEQVGQVLFLKGKVKKVKPESKMISLKPKKGKSLHFIVPEQAKTIGFKMLDELEPKQQLKIWYVRDGEKNRAIKVERLPELGC